MGGSGTPPDKRGYRVITLPDNNDQAEAQLNAAEDAGYKVVSFSGNRVILSNYGKD